MQSYGRFKLVTVTVGSGTYDIEGWVLGISKQTISMCIQLWAKMYEWDLTGFYICLKPLIKITMLCWKNDVNPMYVSDV